MDATQLSVFHSISNHAHGKRSSLLRPCTLSTLFFEQETVWYSRYMIWQRTALKQLIVHVFITSGQTKMKTSLGARGLLVFRGLRSLRILRIGRIVYAYTVVIACWFSPCLIVQIISFCILFSYMQWQLDAFVHIRDLLESHFFITLFIALVDFFVQGRPPVLSMNETNYTWEFVAPWWQCIIMCHIILSFTIQFEISPIHIHLLQGCLTLDAGLSPKPF